MNGFWLLSIGFLIGVIFSKYWFFRSAANNLLNFNQEQALAKAKNLEKILANAGNEITNDQVQQLLGVSNATAERYLDELETQGKLRQVGARGKYVIYRRIQ